MKVCRLMLLAVAGMGLIGCDSMSGPMSSGSFDPLSPPGSYEGPPVVDAGGGIVPGQIVTISTDNAAFFKERPRGDGDPDKLLRAGTMVKVVAVDGSYLKVELDSGNVGFVPAMMVTSSTASPSANEVQVYPPVPGSGAIPIVPLDPVDVGDPASPASEDLPEVIEPDGSSEEVPLPPPPPVPDDLGTPAPPIAE